MLGALEIVLIIIVIGGILFLQGKTRTGSLFPYLAVGILLLTLIAAMRIIRSLVSMLLILTLLCGFLLWARTVRHQNRGSLGHQT
jgi:uncharacterized membrane protein